MRPSTKAVSLLVLVAAMLSQGYRASAQITAKPSTTFALVGGRVIVGDGSPAHPDWTVLVRDGRITAVGPVNRVRVPAGVTTIDVRGKSVIPGLIDAHGHHYANLGGRCCENMFATYPPLFLAGGVTSVISPGDFDPEGMYALKARINEHEAVGARIFMGGYYINNISSQSNWLETIRTPAEAAQRVEDWKDRVDIVKFYTAITEDEMRAAIAVAKKYGIPTTAHLGDQPGAVTASRAIDLGINGLEHGLETAMRTFYDGDPALDEKAPCPLGDIDLDRPVVQALIDKIVRNRIAIDPTIVQWREWTEGFEPVTPDYRRFYSQEYQQRFAARDRAIASTASRALSVDDSLRLAAERACQARTIAKEEEYVRRIWAKGGRLLVGTDPVGPDLIPGYALYREMQILAHAGIPPLEVIKAASYNAAVAIRHDKDIGSIAAGKLADLVVVDGDPSVRIDDVAKTVMVFQAGVRYDPEALRKSAEGKIKLPPPPPPPPKPTYTAEEVRDAACGGAQRLGCGLGPEQFALIPAGSFQMGSDSGSANERPAHRVTISHPFSMQKTEVTQAQWRAVMDTNPSYSSACGDACPVDRVSWDDIQRFLSKLNATSPGVTYRLPTEAEWEYAARAGTTGDAYGPLDSIAWYLGNSGRKVHAVAGRKPNAWGLYDMIGNLYEWVNDWYGPYSGDAAIDPAGAAIGTIRVIRGGMNMNNRSYVRSASRSAAVPPLRDGGEGFRLVRIP